MSVATEFLKDVICCQIGRKIYVQLYYLLKFKLYHCIGLYCMEQVIQIHQLSNLTS